MRGTPPRASSHWRGSGIIPAYAGNTYGYDTGITCNGDHPRVCGEHLRDLRERNGLTGSSPRMRGTPIRCVPWLRIRWIIPAYAGNTVRVQPTVLRTRDHPRVCGEHSRYSLALVTAVGSSPRMRGTPVLVYWCAVAHRGSSPRMRGTPSAICCCPSVAGIIPAYAGNTLYRMQLFERYRDHPRVCGEHLVFANTLMKGAGSSPRMRGTQC